jgi:hypothetical protein
MHAFILSTEKTRMLRATDALINTGSSVSLAVLQVASGSSDRDPQHFQTLIAQFAGQGIEEKDEKEKRKIRRREIREKE